MTYSIFHFLTTYKVEEKRDARDLGKRAAASLCTDVPPPSGKIGRGDVDVSSPDFSWERGDVCTQASGGGKRGRERDSAGLFLPSPRAFSASIFTISAGRPILLTQCCTQVKSPGLKILCVLYLHHNEAFTFKWYWKFLMQNVSFPKGLNWVQHWVGRIGLLPSWSLEQAK